MESKSIFKEKLHAKLNYIKTKKAEFEEIKHTVCMENAPYSEKLFLFENLRKNNIYLCSLIKDKEPCHDIETSKFYCFNCYCPNYDYYLEFDSGKQMYVLGKCSINSHFGSLKETHLKDFPENKYLIHSCQKCSIPHLREYTRLVIKKKCSLEK